MLCRVRLNYATARLRLHRGASTALLQAQKSSSPWQLLQLWKDSGQTGEDHVAALYHLGRLTRGRGTSENKAGWERHDAMQFGLQDEPAFADLLEAVREAIPSLEQKGLSRVLMGLGDTHEDLPFAHATTPDAHLQRVVAVAEAACLRLQAFWKEATSEDLDDRDLGFPLFALSRLAIYSEDTFAVGSAHLAAKIRGELPAAALRQWLLACNSVNHSLAEHETPIAAYKPSGGWGQEEDSRLHQMAGALVVFRNPDPLLADVLLEVLRRPANQMKSSKAVALYGLQAVRLLSEALGGEALQRCGFEPVHDVLAGPGLSADFRCLRRGRSFFVEVDGPSHFCVRPFWRPRGRTVLKRRLFACLGYPLVSVPYWLAAAPGAYARRDLPARPPSLEAGQEEIERLVTRQLDLLEDPSRQPSSDSEFWWAVE
eukprot:s2843_g2.t1